MHKKKIPDPIPNKRLREQRELRGWTQEKLAEKVETSAVTVSRWESGILPSLYHRRKLCELFGKSPQELGFIREGIDEESNATSLGTLLWPPIHIKLRKDELMCWAVLSTKGMVVGALGSSGSR